MSDLAQKLEEARALLASEHEAKAVELLHDVIEEADDPELLRQIHALAVEAHERADGFQKIEWHKIAVETEPEASETVTHR